MKVISQQTIGVSIRDGFDVFRVQAREIWIVSGFLKQIFAIVATIVDVVVHAGLERSGCVFHVFPLARETSHETSQVSKTCDVWCQIWEIVTDFEGRLQFANAGTRSLSTSSVPLPREAPCRVGGGLGWGWFEMESRK